MIYIVMNSIEPRAPDDIHEDSSIIVREKMLQILQNFSSSLS